MASESSQATVLVTRRVPRAVLDAITRHATLRIWEGDNPIPRETLLEWLPGCAGLYCMLTDRIDPEVLDAGSSLRVISQMAVGVDNIDLSACTARGIPVGNTPGVLTETTADLALALILATLRRVIESAAFIKAGQWVTWRPMELVGRDLHHSTVGIIGFGRIGKAVAKRLRGFDCHILYTQRSPDPDAARLGAAYVDLPTLLASSDVVTLHCPLTVETRGLIGARELAQMRQEAILVNTSRGPVIDQAALVEALAAGRIAGAGLDVTDPEPIPSDSPLLSMPQVVVLPHIGSATIATRTKMAELAADNLIAGLAGKRLPHPANPAVYPEA